LETQKVLLDCESPRIWELGGNTFRGSLKVFIGRKKFLSPEKEKIGQNLSFGVGLFPKRKAPLKKLLPKRKIKVQ